MSTRSLNLGMAPPIHPSIFLTNTSLPISRLPNEALINIFGYCDTFEGDLARHPDDLRNRRYLSWTRVLHVCRRWYYVGVSCPSLWQTVSSSRGYACTREILRRSRGLPLNIYIPRIDASTLNATLVLLLAEAPRTRTLSIHLPHRYRRVLARTTARVAAKWRMLEDLTVFATSARGASPLHIDRFFPHELSRLKTLHVIAECHLGSLPSARNVEQLTLATLYKPELGREPWTLCIRALKHALRSMPHLAHLNIANLVPELAGDVREEDTEFVPLPALRSLCVRGAALPVFLLSASVIAPSDARIALDFEIEDPNDVRAVHMATCNLFQRQSSDGRVGRCPLRSLLLSSTLDLEFVIEGSSGNDELLQPSRLYGDPTRDFRLGVTRSYGWRGTDADVGSLSALLQNLPLSEVRTLNVVGLGAKNILVPRPLRRDVLDGMAALALDANYAPRTKDVSPGCRGSKYSGANEDWRAYLPGLETVAWDPRSRREHAWGV
ncbi:F-box protein [Phanerochaete sordida]|uniref:F-box protein n=1 Tax=Phanerochaete sordida TaxID=48140 RepID=A0A9P3GFG0_9APHY|nr:F-box protein [Phanerochaete sordida]